MDKDISFVITMLENCISLLKECNQDVDSKLKETEVKENPIRENIVNLARYYIGKCPYVYGGKDIKKGIDCSGFTQTIYLECAVQGIPGNWVNSTGQRKWGKEVLYLNDARPGDLICYDGHVAIYVGNNKIVDAGNSVKGITERSVNIMPIRSIRNVIGD